MIQDFNKIAPIDIPSMKGGEGIAHVRAASSLPRNVEKIMRVTLVKGASLGYHEHQANAELMFCISGEGIIRLADGDHPFLPGMLDITAEGASHAVRNESDEPLELIAAIISTK